MKIGDMKALWVFLSLRTFLGLLFVTYKVYAGSENLDGAEVYAGAEVYTGAGACPCKIL